MKTERELIEGLLQFVTLVEAERKLLAADLHDQTLSDLRELARLARRLIEKPEDAMSQEVRNGIAKLLFGIESAMDEVRRAMENLSPSALDTLGFVPAIESCLTRASQSCEKPFLTRFACIARADDLAMSETKQLLLYRIVQEALNNISKHAMARFVEVVIMREGDGVLIRVRDDGRGMTPSGNLGRARGLENMRYRARLIDAELTWLNATGRRGTVVEIRVPIQGSGAHIRGLRVRG
ncbi:MAG TPA: ATP-binding protein [Blastocatellia bacterium]|nr:ATP-binding protein [Blastocatellia bacterium]